MNAVGLFWMGPGSLSWKSMNIYYIFTISGALQTRSEHMLIIFDCSMSS